MPRRLLVRKSGRSRRLHKTTEEVAKESFDSAQISADQDLLVISQTRRNLESRQRRQDRDIVIIVTTELYDFSHCRSARVVSSLALNKVTYGRTFGSNVIFQCR